MVEIRLATPADAADLVAIYQPYVLNTNITFEYTVPSVEEFEKRVQETLLEFPYLVALDQEKIIGYAYAHEYKERAAYDWAVEVSVYVDSEARQKGCGKALYQALESELKKQNILILTACITGGNEGSVAFHEKFGYQQVAAFKKIGFKFNQWHDVLWLQKMLQTAPENVPAKIAYKDVVNKLKNPS